MRRTHTHSVAVLEGAIRRSITLSATHVSLPHRVVTPFVGCQQRRNGPEFLFISSAASSTSLMRLFTYYRAMPGKLSRLYCSLPGTGCWLAILLDTLRYIINAQGGLFTLQMSLRETIVPVSRIDPLWVALQWWPSFNCRLIRSRNFLPFDNRMLRSQFEFPSC